MPSEQRARSFEDGIHEGKIIALEQIIVAQNTRLDKVESRVSTLERVAYTLLGAVALVQFAPALKGFIQ